MAGKRQPTDAVKARGKKHLSSQEEERRRASEVQGEGPRHLSAPGWLGEEAKEVFRTKQRLLINLMPTLVSKLDADTLAAYCVAFLSWRSASEKTTQAIESGNSEAADIWGKIQDRHFKQARACAADLGMTLSARCQLVVPPAPKAEKNPLLTLMENYRKEA